MSVTKELVGIMVENSKIEWTNHTFNPWIGCTNIGPGCDHCYAETLAHRFQMAEWGTGKPRLRTKEHYWNDPIRWNKQAEKVGVRARVFCASLADVFDNEVDPAWRDDLFALIRKTPWLDWLLLTKRVGNVRKMLPADWGTGYSNVWLGITVVNQTEAERDIPKFESIPTKVRFLSMEPLLEPVKLNSLSVDHGGRMNALLHDRIHWVIVGGESGKDARPMNPVWVRNLRDQCAEFNVPFLFKQWGEYFPGQPFATESRGNGGCQMYWPDGKIGDGDFFTNGGLAGQLLLVGKKKAGRILDGRTWDGYPTQTQQRKD